MIAKPQAPTPRPVRPEPARPCVVRTRPDSNIFRGWGVSI
jgi:hypothetical protein